MFSIKKLLALSVSSVMLVSAFPALSSAEGADHTVADWKFTQSNATGSIASGSMSIADVSGNGNTLTMRTYGTNYQGTAAFSDEALFGDEGSLFINGNLTDGAIDFVTEDNAPINKENFPDGYTIEILYKMPDDWTTADRWTSLISRLGSTDAIDTENESVTSVVHVSNCKEIQFIPANMNNKSTLSSNVWSIAMDKAENWYSIVITYDNTAFHTYINGAASFRDITTSDMQGLYADPADGRFRIGSRILASGTPYRFTRGYFQEIRISDKALPRDEWLVPNPEEYLGEYGDNSPFEETAENRYNFVFLPDMQNAVQYKSDILDTAAQWIVENKDFANIAGVISLGDNVNDFWDTPQWENVERSMKILANGGVKTLVQPGNHDSGNGANYWYFGKYFGPDSDFQKLVSDYVECSSPSGTGFVMDAPAGSFNYKVITIDMYKLGDASETGWFREQLTKYRTSPVIIVSHDIQNCSDTAPNETHLSTNGAALWNIVKDYDNVFLMVGGHSHGYGTLALTNSYGHTVYSVLADYQFSYNGGNAIFKFAEFDEDDNKIRLSSFSPYVATLSDEDKSFFDVNFMTGKGHNDELDFNFEERLGSLQYYEYGDNLIENDSFEENTDGWTYDNNGSFGSLEGWARSDEKAHNGSYSLKKTVTSGNGGSSNNNIGTYIPIESGYIYRLTWWEYSSESIDAGYHQMMAAVVTTNNTAALNDTSNRLPSCGGWDSWNSGAMGQATRDPAYTAGWTQREYIFDTTNAANAEYILIAYANGSSTTANYLDDFSLTEAHLTTYTRTAIKNVSAAADGETVSVSLDFISGENPDAAIIAAGYNENGEVVSIGYVEDGAATLKGSDITEVKVFCWKGLSNLKPLTQTEITSLK